MTDGDAAPGAKPASVAAVASPSGAPEEGDAPPAATASAEGIAGRALALMPGRREAMFLLVGGVLGAALGGGYAAMTLRPDPPVVRDDDEELSAREARARLDEGNARFVAGLSIHPDQTTLRRTQIAGAQKPFAIVLACADSRVPPEVVFDQGLGDLFVVRSAGQVVDDAVLGSLQYAVQNLDAALLVVLGHSQCGAVRATVEAIKEGTPASGTQIDALVEAITPAVEEAYRVGAEGGRVLPVSIDMNTERIVERLKETPIIEEAAKMRDIRVLGATYSVKTGEVSWL